MNKPLMTQPKLTHDTRESWLSFSMKTASHRGDGMP